MFISRKLAVVLLALFTCGQLLWSDSALAFKNKSYKAGYVIGFMEQPSVKGSDPSITHGKYAAEKREILKKKGEVSMSFYRGLKDGFRDATRDRKPDYTIEDVDLEQLPPHLHPKP
ncbi:MAG: hypothetical protein SVY10_00430 [Thermodesulfobacteriota bacterium]|nr:hypothetical protein [Thermodesulfobacteriota bacterium]